MKRTRWVFVAVAVAGVVALVALAVGQGNAESASSASTGSQVTTHWRATVAKLPANAATGKSQFVSITSISCAASRNCTAVGSYLGNGGDQEGLLLTEKAGHWARGVEAALPANAGSDPQVELGSVSCASAGNCTAVGTYFVPPSDIYSEGGISGLLLTEKAGHWAAGVEAVLPANSTSDPQVNFTSVSCASAGNCTAVGNFRVVTSGGSDGLLITEKAGHWARGVDVAQGPLGAEITSVSCSPNGSCGAVGYLRGGEEFRSGLINGAGLLLSKKRGKWSDVSSKLIWPRGGPGEAAILTTVSCASAGNCSATGLYNIGIDYESAGSGALFTEKAGKWQRGVTAKPPKNARSAYFRNYVDLNGISCASPGNCDAMGIYYGRRNAEHLTFLTEEAGKWRRGVEAVLPRGAGHPDTAGFSCASAGNCTVVGSRFRLTEIAGRWARGVRTPFAATSSFSVSCAAPGNCGAVAGFYGAKGVLLDSITKP